MLPRLLVVLFLAFAPAAFAADSTASGNTGHGKEVSAEERYELGLRYMRRGYYTKALEAFNRVRNYHRDDPISVKAELAIADVYYKKGEYEQARMAYEDFARLHPRHEDLDYVIWREGMCLSKRAPKFAGRDQTPTRQAVNVWTGFSDRFPESEHKLEVAEQLQKSRNRLARKELAIARFYERRGAWLAVRRRAEGLVKRYPDADVVPEALALAGQAYHEWGLEDDAHALRDKLAASSPDSDWLKHLDRELAKPPGEPPQEVTFLRPYRLPSTAGATANPIDQ